MKSSVQVTFILDSGLSAAELEDALHERFNVEWVASRADGAPITWVLSRRFCKCCDAHLPMHLTGCPAGPRAPGGPP